MKSTKPLVYHYLSASQFLADWIVYRKQKDVRFTYKKWAAEMDIPSRSYLRLLVIGERPLTDAVLLKLAVNIGLTSTETGYFSVLVKYQSAASQETREIYGKILSQFWNQSIEALDVTDVEAFLTDTIAPVVFIYLSYSDTIKTIDGIATHLEISTERAQKVVATLRYLQLIKMETDLYGQIIYSTLQPFFKVPDQNANQFVKKFHLEGLTLAENAQNLPFEKRKYHSVMVSLSEAQLKMARSLIEEFSDRVLKTFQAQDAKGKSIYRLNMQLFPVSKDIA